MTLQDTSAIANILISMLTVGAVWYAAMEIRYAKKALKAQLVNSLETEFRYHYAVYHKLLPGRAWSNESEGPKTDEDLVAIEAYLEFFEKIKILIDSSSIDLDTIDKMFAFRFFLITNNIHVQKQVIFRDAPYFGALFALHEHWSTYRKTKRGREILYEETSLDTSSPDTYKKGVATYHE